MVTIGRRPRAPLVPVDRPELAVRVSPLIPDRHVVLAEPPDVRLAAEEPQQLVDNRTKMQLLRGEQRKTGGQVEAQLGSENAERARAGAIRFRVAVIEDVLDELEVLLHD